MNVQWELLDQTAPIFVSAEISRDAMESLVTANVYPGTRVPTVIDDVQIYRTVWIVDTVVTVPMEPLVTQSMELVTAFLVILVNSKFYINRIKWLMNNKLHYYLFEIGKISCITAVALWKLCKYRYCIKIIFIFTLLYSF